MGHSEPVAEPAEPGAGPDAVEESAPTDAEPVLSTRRWSRAGRDFLHLSLEDGTEVARADLVSGELHYEVPALAQRARHTVEVWKAEQERATDTDTDPDAEDESDAGTDDPTEVEVETDVADDGDDLAAREPGAVALERARRLRRERGALRAWLFDARSGDRELRAAVRGERLVARRLRSLPAGWHVVHAVPAGDDDVDHVAIGPAGVYCLTTRNHVGAQVTVTSLAVVADRRETSDLDDARHAAQLVTDHLSESLGREVPVHPVLVVLARHMSVKRQPEDVAVVGRKGVARWLRARPDQLDPDTVAAVAQHAGRRTTWT